MTHELWKKLAEHLDKVPNTVENDARIRSRLENLAVTLGHSKNEKEEHLTTEIFLKAFIQRMKELAEEK